MRVFLRPFLTLPAIVLFSAMIVLCYDEASFAQDSGINLALHANSHASAGTIGLPVYPGATVYKDGDSDSAADLGLTMGDFHFSLLDAKYVTSDSPTLVLAFYRKHLLRYGDVLECSQGNPVGTPTTTRDGLTCGDAQRNRDKSSSADHELRAGSQHRFRIVGIDDAKPGSTRFELVYLELPKDNAGDK